MSEEMSRGSSVPVASSVKGTAFKSVVEDIRLLVEAGVITPADQDKDLTPDDLELLDGMVTAIGWYPMETYSRLMELLARKQAPPGEREEYFITRGYRAAERLLGGTYRVLDAELSSWGPRAGEVIMGLGRTIYNFGTWHFREVEPGSYEIEGRCGSDFSDAARFAVQGFLNFVASRASGRTIEASSHRPDEHRVIYRFHEQG